MFRKVIILFLAAALVVSFASIASAGKRPHPGKLTYAPLAVKTPTVIDIALPNGLSGFLVEDHEIPIVDVAILVKTYYPAHEKYGLNEMARWVIRNGGTATWPEDKLNDELEFLAAGVEIQGGDLWVTISMNCLKKDLPKVLGIFADLVMNPAFPADKVDMKRKTMLEEIRRQNDEPNEIVRREYSKLVYGDHPFAWDAEVSTVNAVTRDDLVAFHAKYFHPNNAIIGVSGDVTKDEVNAALASALGSWQKADVEIPKVPDFTPKTAKQCAYAYKDISQAYVAIGHEGLSSNAPDRCAANIMNFILGGGSFTSWITEKVRSDEGLAYHAASRITDSPWALGLFTANVQTKGEAFGRATQLIIELIDKMRTEGPTAEEVKKAVDSYVNGQVFDYESKAQVVRRLMMLRFQGRPLDTPQRDMETYAKLTVADVKAAAQKYLHPDRLTLMVVGDAKLFDRPVSDFGPVKEIELKTE